MADLISIVDDDVAFRASVAQLLQLRGYEVAQFDTTDLFLEGLSNGESPGCAVLEARLPGLSGPALQKRLEELGFGLPIIFLTGIGDVPTAVQAIKAGAEDVLTKPVSGDALIESIERAITHFRQNRSKREWCRSARALVGTLTPREKEVFQFVVRGKPNKQAARELGITERTVKAHRHRVFEKLHARTVADLVSLAERLEMLPAPDVGAEIAATRR